MNKVHDVYDRMLIDDRFLQSAICAAENTAPRKRSYQKPIIAACAAALALGLVAAVLIIPSGIRKDKTDLSVQPQISYDTAARFGVYGNSDDSLLSYDGFTAWIEGAYYNGKTMTVAVKGDYERYAWKSDSLPDTMKAELTDRARFIVSGREVKPLSDKMVLLKNGSYFEGTLELDVGFDESVVMLEIELPGLEICGEGKRLKTVDQTVRMKNVISRIYTNDEEALLSGGDVMCVSHVAAYPEGAIGDAPVGIELEYYVPDSVCRGENAKNVMVRITGEDGGEIAAVRTAQMTNATGKIVSEQFGSANSRHIGIVLYDEKTGEVLFAFSAFLNDPVQAISLDD